MIAYLSEEDWNRITAKEGLAQFAPHAINDINKPEDHLREIRKKGYAFSDEEIDREVRAVGASILNALGELVAGLSIAVPAYRISKKRVSSLGRLMMQYAQGNSSQLGYGVNRMPLKVRRDCYIRGG